MRLITDNRTFEVINSTSIIYNVEDKIWESIHIDLKEQPSESLRKAIEFRLELEDKIVQIFVKTIDLNGTVLRIEPLYCKLL